ncbi:MAG: RNA-binding S4 domain-containing protein [Methyloceanibacter sp.]
MPAQRLDKWLWCARLVKTRTGAARLIAGGHVRVNSERARKPSRPVNVGDVITATQLGRLSVVRVKGAVERRGPPSLALTLYDDLTPKDASGAGGKHEDSAKSHGPRPTKRDRRRIGALRNGDA